MLAMGADTGSANPLRQALVAIVTAVAVATCATPPSPIVVPTPTPPAAPASVVALQAWLLERTFTCDAGVPGHAGDVWTCTLDQDTRDTGTPYPLDLTRFRVEITATPAGVTRVVAIIDQSRNGVPDPDHGIGFLSETIGASPITGDSGPAIMAWADEHWRGGGTVTVGSVTMHLAPFSLITRGELDFDPPA